MEQEYGNGWAAGMESCVEFSFTVREFGHLLPRPQRGREHRGGSKVKIIPVRSIKDKYRQKLLCIHHFFDKSALTWKIIFSRLTANDSVNRALIP